MQVFGHGTLEPSNRINSAESFERLSRVGVDGVELDVRLSADGIPVVIHDHEYRDERRVRDTAADDRPADVLTLTQALELCREMTVNVELKNHVSDPDHDPDARVATEVARVLSQRPSDDILISSFDLACLDASRRLLPDVPTAHLVLSRKPAQEVAAAAAAGGHEAIHPYIDMVDEAFVAVARGHGLSVNVWSSFEETDEMVGQMMALGVDGLITSRPERVLELLGRR